jgi:hypothetical protein
MAIDPLQMRAKDDGLDRTGFGKTLVAVKRRVGS